MFHVTDVRFVGNDTNNVLCAGSDVNVTDVHEVEKGKMDDVGTFMQVRGRETLTVYSDQSSFGFARKTNNILFKCLAITLSRPFQRMLQVKILRMKPCYPCSNYPFLT